MSSKRTGEAGWNANVVFEDGTFYQVRLEWLPRVGESIQIQSYLELSEGDQSILAGVVERVVHFVSDSHNGRGFDSHTAEIYVRRVSAATLRPQL